MQRRCITKASFQFFIVQTTKTRIVLRNTLQQFPEAPIFDLKLLREYDNIKCDV